MFEASLPPDLAAMYRQLAVLLPQAPVPLVTVLQLWGITDPQEAQETVQIFVMQVRMLLAAAVQYNLCRVDVCVLQWVVQEPCLYRKNQLSEVSCRVTATWRPGRP